MTGDEWLKTIGLMRSRLGVRVNCHGIPLLIWTSKELINIWFPQRAMNTLRSLGRIQTE